MPKPLTIHGLPQSIALDGWWLSHDTHRSTHDDPPPESDESERGDTWRPAAHVGLLALILAGDVLFWGYQLGINLALFAWCVFVAAGLRSGATLIRPKHLLVMALTTLPVIEHVQFLSISFLVLGLFGAVAWLHLGKNGAGWVGAAFFSLIRAFPRAAPVALRDQLRHLRRSIVTDNTIQNERMRALLRNWALPTGGTLILGALLLEANPVLEQFVSEAFQNRPDLSFMPGRILFWGGLGLILWPLLHPTKPTGPLACTLPHWDGRFGFNAGSVLRALFMFNIFIAIQTAFDFSILVGGAALPEDMSYATYAHRGAYPLLVTAILAGMFTLAARPYLTSHPVVKPLLLLWVVQNVLITLAAILRLDLYIAEYGLTFLRLYALIWMGLVASGLLLILWQVFRNRSAPWLLIHVAALAFGTLYLCTFVNFAGLIATDTVDRIAESETAHRIDWDYFCALGPTAQKAVVQAAQHHSKVTIPNRIWSCFEHDGTGQNWREWGFRIARTGGYLGAMISQQVDDDQNPSR